jgi:hypothetical protein
VQPYAKAAEESAAKDAASKTGTGFASKVTGAMYAAVDALPAFAAPADAPLRAGVDYLAANDYALYGALALVGAVILMSLLMCIMPGGSDDAADEVGAVITVVNTVQVVNTVLNTVQVECS